ncbi:hypothetical protein [Peptoniphilus porci]|uniref:Uncharacterized protein n=1 Tax=Peptoniphilus porci TaxID=2652280 RepID=A0A1U7LX78_9FIRM|nr:hypothetical protein [Peptoniphilus porci]OLR61679.1 hypothetical protein BIV18_10015 [Peptoniphilus porci]
MSKQNIRHFIEIKDDNKTIYRRRIFNRNIVADKEFYENLNLNIDWMEGKLEETEISLLNFMTEWWKFIDRITDRNSLIQDLDFLFAIKDNKSLYSNLVFQNHTMINQFFLVMDDLLKFTLEYDEKTLCENYKLYISVNN